MPWGARVSGAGPATPENDEPADSEVLRAKYLDYCSAQVADLLLFLTPDEIYLIAQRATAESAADAGPVSYMRMVEVATEWLAGKVALPPFEVWAEDYAAHPDRYEAYFMGLWESDLAPPREGGGQ